jgi:SRSO17 transposase
VRGELVPAAARGSEERRRKARLAKNTLLVREGRDGGVHRSEERGGFRRCTWRKGTQEDLSANFALRRVIAAGVPQREQEPLWLLIEWRDGELEPANFFLVSLPGHRTKKQLVRWVMQRWRTERAYEDLKGELGLDHYEGRRFPGWHHHISVALCCYAFLIAERVRRFPLSARGEDEAHAQQLQA